MTDDKIDAGAPSVVPAAGAVPSVAEPGAQPVAGGEPAMVDPAIVDRLERNFEIVLSSLAPVLRAGGVTAADAAALDRLLDAVAGVGNVAIAQIEAAGGTVPTRRATRAELFERFEHLVVSYNKLTEIAIRLETTANAQHAFMLSTLNTLRLAEGARKRGAKLKEREGVALVRQQLAELLADSTLPQAHPWVTPEVMNEMLEALR
jgi:hypothetical protein